MHPKSLSKKPISLAITFALLGPAAMLAVPAQALAQTDTDIDTGGITQQPDAKVVRITTPTADTTLTVSGYVKGDLIVDEGADLGDSFAVSAIPMEGSTADGRDGHVRMHARQSRVRVVSETALEDGSTLKAHVEGDFYGSGGNESFSNSTGFRLRHAYAEYGRWTIGQTWTNFMDLVAYPNTVDFFGPVGKSFVRQGQIRYTLPSGFAFSIENPETDGDGALGRLRESTGGVGEDSLPDVVVAWRGGPGGLLGNYEFGAVYRQLGVNGELEDGTLIDENENGWGVNLAGAWSLGLDTFATSVAFGDGIGRYIINGGGNDVFVDASGRIETVESLGASISYQHGWSANSSSTLAYGYFENDDPSASNGIDTLSSVHLNYMMTPIPETTFGVEYMYGDAEFDVGEGDASRVQFSAQLNF